MNPSRMATIVALSVLVTGVALAQQRTRNQIVRKTVSKPMLRSTSDIRPIRPISIAGMKDGVVVTPYFPMVEDNDWPGGPWSTVFDCIELSPVTGTAPNGAPYENPAYGPAYMLAGNYGLTANTPGARFWSGDTFENMFVTNDMRPNPLYAGFEAQRLAFMWRWNPTLPGETMIINVAIADTFADTPAGLAPPMGGGPDNVSWSGFLDGVSLNFGNGGGAGVTPGNYFANIDISAGANPLDLMLPADGSGAYLLQLLNSTAPPTLASRGHFFYWITKQANTNLPGGNHSFQDKWQWDDDTDITSTSTTFVNNSDGRHFTNPPGPNFLTEFYDYSAATALPPGPITEPLGAAFGLYSSFGAFTAESSSDVSVAGGIQLGGTFQSLVKVDGNSIQVLNDEINAVGSLTLTTHSGASTTTAISVMTSSSATRPDISEFLEIQNASTSAWSQLNFRTVPTTMSPVRVNITTNAANFIAPNGDVKVRFVWIPQTDIDSGDGWAQFVDRMTVFVKGAQAD